MNWDSYFLYICDTVSKKSPCLSRQIGAILVRDNSIVSTGYNGPPRGIPHCGYDRLTFDKALRNLMPQKQSDVAYIESTCPRKVLGYESGTHMELCPAQHAEENAVSNAARNGVSVLGCSLYMNTRVVPCQKCFGTLINAGISEIVVLEVGSYDAHTEFIIKNSRVVIRKFNL